MMLSKIFIKIKKYNKLYFKNKKTYLTLHVIVSVLKYVQNILEDKNYE